MITKTCTKCGIVKPLEDFCKGSRYKDGRKGICKKCHSEISSKYQKEHIEETRDRNKKYYQNNIDRLKDAHKEYRTKNKAKIKEKYKEYHEKYRPIKNERMRQFRKTPAGRIYELNKIQQRRRRIFNLSNTLTSIQWNKILEIQKNKCAICGKNFCKSRPPTIDHIIPLSKGGGLTFENVQALCRSCNSSKCDKIDLSLITSYGVFS